MGLPWITKKYLDTVISAGIGKVTYKNDGRSKKDPLLRYGDGGLMTKKNYMLSITYNCPKSEFENKEGFFEGLSVDQTNVAVHKVFQFCGMKQKQTYSIHDIFKGNLDMTSELEKFTNILESNFKKKKPKIKLKLN